MANRSGNAAVPLHKWTRYARNGFATELGLICFLVVLHRRGEHSDLLLHIHELMRGLSAIGGRSWYCSVTALIQDVMFLTFGFNI
jgi:hypothetical protein